MNGGTYSKLRLCAASVILPARFRLASVWKSSYHLEDDMYLVRRVYTIKPGQARKAASLVHEMGKAYQKAGTRSESRVYFNSGTTPGERNTVVMEWTDETLRTPYRDGRAPVEGLDDVRSEFREIASESHIEFWELMTDDKQI